MSGVNVYGIRHTIICRPLLPRAGSPRYINVCRAGSPRYVYVPRAGNPGR